MTKKNSYKEYKQICSGKKTESKKDLGALIPSQREYEESDNFWYIIHLLNWRIYTGHTRFYKETNYSNYIVIFSP